eukprot:CAMPEP_0117661360 /NCGR_PEP_ID=MMETSP0804-20121206/7495_1 /TAXON_ID=1074897 /ORGANISM="Tetraselmis astigmatica, Strain CCMP880" /LENGTH=289 /DNA_ID=CAMNT_0005468221 /DNA_START=131 /DNA_END=1002 /DNA_ORIENTATION=+
MTGMPTELPFPQVPAAHAIQPAGALLFVNVPTDKLLYATVAGLRHGGSEAFHLPETADEVQLPHPWVLPEDADVLPQDPHASKTERWLEGLDELRCLQPLLSKAVGADHVPFVLPLWVYDQNHAAATVPGCAQVPDLGQGVGCGEQHRGKPIVPPASNSISGVQDLCAHPASEAANLLETAEKALNHWQCNRELLSDASSPACHFQALRCALEAELDLLEADPILDAIRAAVTAASHMSALTSGSGIREAGAWWMAGKGPAAMELIAAERQQQPAEWRWARQVLAAAAR